MTNNNNNNNLITQCSGNHKNDQMRITLVPKHEIKKKKPTNLFTISKTIRI